MQKKGLGRDLWQQCCSVFGLPEAARELFGLQFDAPDDLKAIKSGSVKKHAAANTSAPAAGPGATAAAAAGSFRQWLLMDDSVADQLGPPRPDRTLVLFCPFYC